VRGSSPEILPTSSLFPINRIPVDCCGTLLYRKEPRMKNSSKPLVRTGVWACLLAWVLTACAPATLVPTTIPVATITPQVASREAQVQKVEVQLLQTNPSQVRAVVDGVLTESCASLGESRVQYALHTFQIKVYVTSPQDIGCAPITTPFETMIPLDTKDLSPGRYNVIANGMSTDFTLPMETPTSTPEPPVVAAPTSTACIDSATFVTDVTVPDNSMLDSNIAFMKTWRIKNSGTCTWDGSYLVAYLSGATMSQQPGYWIVPQGQTIAPGQTVDISVGMTSPVENGIYVSYCGLKKANGSFMPIAGGANGNSFYVKIKVNNGRVEGNVTAASITIEPEQGSGRACTPDSTYLVHASITSAAAASVAYEIDSTAGQTTAGFFQSSPMGPVLPSVTGTLNFDQADTQTIDLRFVGPYPYPDHITVLLWVNHTDWYQGKLSCDSN